MYRVVWEDKNGDQGETDWMETIGFACDHLASIAQFELQGGFNWIQIETKQ